MPSTVDGNTVKRDLIFSYDNYAYRAAVEFNESEVQTGDLGSFKVLNIDAYDMRVGGSKPLDRLTREQHELVKGFGANRLNETYEILTEFKPLGLDEVDVYEAPTKLHSLTPVLAIGAIAFFGILFDTWMGPRGY